MVAQPRTPATPGGRQSVGGCRERERWKMMDGKLEYYGIRGGEGARQPLERVHVPVPVPVPVPWRNNIQNFFKKSIFD